MARTWSLNMAEFVADAKRLGPQGAGRRVDGRAMAVDRDQGAYRQVLQHDRSAAETAFQPPRNGTEPGTGIAEVEGGRGGGQARRPSS